MRVERRRGGRELEDTITNSAKFILLTVLALSLSGAALGCSGEYANETATAGRAGVCGDGVADDGEECDDGNGEDGDACTNACALAYCGDGVVQFGVEECDDGDSRNDNMCNDSCHLNPVCGDGSIDEGEVCDDGDSDDANLCANTCTLNLCNKRGGNKISNLKGGGDEFPSSLAFFGDTVVIGDDDPYKDKPKAYVCQRRGEDWVLVDRLKPSSPYERFGISAAFDGETIVIGAPNQFFSDEGGEPKGAVYFYNISEDGTWERTASFDVNTDTYDGFWGGGDFGRTVAVDGSTIAVAAPHFTPYGEEQGQVFVYERDDQGKWQELTKLAPSPDSLKLQFGWALAVDGDTIAVGAPCEHYGGKVDEVFVYTRSEQGQWEEAAVFQADETNHDYGAFGWSVAIEGGTLVVGAPSYKDAQDDAVFIYQRDETSGEWVDEPVKLPVEPVDVENFGSAVAIKGGVIVAAEQGNLRLFERDGKGGWGESAVIPITPATLSESYPSVHLAFDGELILVGGKESLGNEQPEGAVYIYDKNVWLEP